MRSARPSRPTRASRSRTSRSATCTWTTTSTRRPPRSSQSACRPRRTTRECHNGYGLALKNLKQFEQATTEFKKALELEPELFDALYNAGMTYSDWYEREPRPTTRRNGPASTCRSSSATPGGKDGGFGYVKAANDKLYALSGS